MDLPPPWCDATMPDAVSWHPLGNRPGASPTVEERARGVPGRPVGGVPATPCERAERLEHDAVGQRGGDVGMVVGRADLDHVHTDHRELEAHPAYGVEQLARGQAARLGRAGPRGVPGVADVDVDRQENALAL